MGITRITTGIDPSPSSANALTWAGRFSRAIGVELRAVSAWQLPLVAMMPEAVGALPTDGFMTDQAEALLAKVTADVGVADRCETSVVEGPAGPVLVDESGDDVLVVVGRHGDGQRHGLARVVDFVLGSAAHHVVSHATGPVAVLPADSVWVDAPKVIVGVDGSPASLEALAWAVDVLPPDAQISAVRTFVPWTADPSTPIEVIYTPDVIDAVESELRAWVDTTVARCERSDAVVTTSVEIAAARYALTNPDTGADLIVVGHRGRTGIVKRLLGSVADHVVRHAKVPTIVVRTTN